MPILKKTKIIRCPSNPSGSYDDPGCREEEGQPCWIDARVGEKINLTFNISAGRGETELQVEINKADFPVILEEIAKATPEAAALFSKYSSKALELNKEYREHLKDMYGED